MLFSYNILFQDTGRRLQRIHCRINTLFYDLSGKDCSCIQMSESSSRRRVC